LNKLRLKKRELTREGRQTDVPFNKVLFVYGRTQRTPENVNFIPPSDVYTEGS
jgi:hypothetical protein